MGNAKLLVLGIGTTLGVFAQTAVLLVAIRRQRISLRPLWGIDDRLKRFGAMAAAMVLYVLISQIGLIVTNQIASTAAASGPAIYNYTWLVLMLPFGMIGVTVLTVVMPRLSRNAAADDTAAVLADLSLATRLTMITLIPTVAFMTVGGPAMGSALFAYGHFGDVDAGYLGAAIALSAFTLLPYARGAAAAAGLLRPRAAVDTDRDHRRHHDRQDRRLAARAAPHRQPRPGRRLSGAGQRPGFPGRRDRRLLPAAAARCGRPAATCSASAEVRTILVTATASLLAGLIAHVVDELMGMQRLTAYGGGAGSLLRLFVLAVIMLPILAAVMLRAQVPEAQAALAAFRGWIGAKPAGGKRLHRAAACPLPARLRALPAGQRTSTPANPVQEINCCAPVSSRTLSTGIRLRRRAIRYKNPSGAGIRSNQPGRGWGKDRG